MSQWARRMEEARRIERVAQNTRLEAQGMRCMAEDSGGARCTADASPKHDHRYDIADLPDCAR